MKDPKLRFEKDRLLVSHTGDVILYSQALKNHKRWEKKWKHDRALVKENERSIKEHLRQAALEDKLTYNTKVNKPETPTFSHRKDTALQVALEKLEHTVERKPLKKDLIAQRNLERWLKLQEALKRTNKVTKK